MEGSVRVLIQGTIPPFSGETEKIDENFSQDIRSQVCDLNPGRIAHEAGMTTAQTQCLITYKSLDPSPWDKHTRECIWMRWERVTIPARVLWHVASCLILQIKLSYERLLWIALSRLCNALSRTLKRKKRKVEREREVLSLINCR